MKKNINFEQFEIFGQLINPAKGLLAAAAVFSLLLTSIACNSGARLDAPENKLEISSLVTNSPLEEKSGFFYPTTAYKNEYYAFHIANYELNGADEDSLKLDTANADKQVKVSFLIKKKKVEKPDDLIGEYKGGEPDWAITDVKVYSPTGVVYLKEPKDFRIKINAVNKDVVTGEIEFEDGESKPNKVKGKFAAKPIAGADKKDVATKQ